MNMHMRLLAGAAVLPLTAGAAAASTAIADRDFDIRSGPGAEYQVVAVVPQGDAVEARDCYNGWCHVDYGDRFGWANEASLAGAVAAPVEGEVVVGAPAPVVAAPAPDVYVYDNEAPYVVGEPYEPGYSYGYVQYGVGPTAAYGYGYDNGDQTLDRRRLRRYEEHAPGRHMVVNHVVTKSYGQTTTERSAQGISVRHAGGRVVNKSSVAPRPQY